MWAEAFDLWTAGEPLFLDKKLTVLAEAEQEAHTETSDKAGLISEFLEMKLPADWYIWDLAERRRHIHGDFGEPAGGTETRTQVCVMEIWCELFEGSATNLTPNVRNEVKDILIRMPGWEQYPHGTGRLRFGKLYGPQLCFVRKT